MQKKSNNILILSALDPQGSAGISADILSVNNAGGFSLPLITSLTVQNTNQVFAINPVKSNIIKQQFNAIKQDSSIDIIKIGLLSKENLFATQYIVKNTTAKIVLDPIIKSSTNNNLGNINIIKKLLKNVFLLTPNANELELLTHEKNQELAIKKLNIPWTLITQTDNSNTIIQHKLFKKNQLIKKFNYQKLPGNYHGSGCVLSSSIAAKLLNLTVIEACNYGLKYTYQTLINSKKIGKMQFSPNHQQNKRL